MNFMNTWEIDEALDRHGRDPVLGPAVRVLASLRDVADASSDGWCYSPKPARAASKLMDVIKSGHPCAPYGTVKPTVSDVLAALAPVKSFLTRNADKLDATALARARAALDHLIITRDGFTSLRERGMF